MTVVKHLEYGSTRSYAGELELCTQPLSVAGTPFHEPERLTELGAALVADLWATHGVERLSLRRYSVEIALSAAVPWALRELEIDTIVEHHLGERPCWDAQSLRRMEDGLVEEEITSPTAALDLEAEGLFSQPPGE